MSKSTAKSNTKLIKQPQIETSEIKKKNLAKIKLKNKQIKSEIEIRINSEIERLFIKYEITDELIEKLKNNKLDHDTIYLNQKLNRPDFIELNRILIKLRETNVIVGSIITNICKHIKTEIIKALFKHTLPYTIITIGYPGSGKSTLAKHAMKYLLRSRSLNYANIDIDDISNFCFNINLRPLYRDIIEFFKKLAIEYNISFIYYSTGQYWEDVYDGLYQNRNQNNRSAFCIVNINRETAHTRMITRVIDDYKDRKFGRIIPDDIFNDICNDVDETMMNELINPEIDDADEEPKKFFLYDNNDDDRARLIYNNLIDEPDKRGFIDYIRPYTHESPSQLESTNMFDVLENSPDSIGSSGGTKTKRKKRLLNKTKRK